MSYPYLSDVIKAVTGLDVPIPIAMFGLFVACAMLAAGANFGAELRRMHEAGQLGSARRQVKGQGGVLSFIETPPQEIVTNFTLVVAFAGIVGARIFHILEHLDEFAIAPWGMIFSRSGLSVFGGLIFGAIAGLIFIRRWQLPARPLLDAVAPAMMLGYAIGRIGCQVSGDGDWGHEANMLLKPDWLPSWLWAQTYDNNIFGVLIPAPGVYPTPIYETLMALACFGLLWALRKHPFRTGWLFSVYVVLAGAERLLIEQIRVNPVFNVGGVQATQAELIAVALIVFGTLGLGLLSRRAQGRSAAVQAS
ncbi:prolipoprotein diacylglyceryl transferase [Oxalobacteraceae bacterium]|nr:prolipoprotein diacylglyceryl transferase [Oxalobacteraceae bacterium]